MKKFIAFMIFAIGLMVSLPSTTYGSGSPPDQVSLVEHFDIAPAIAIVQNYNFVAYRSQVAPLALALQEKGGGSIENSLNTYLDAGYSKKWVLITACELTQMYNYHERLCHNSKHNQINTQNIESRTRCTIRADSQG